MAIRVKCASCQKVLNAPDHLAGKKVRCPNPECKSVVAIPAPVTAPGPAPAPAMPDWITPATQAPGPPAAPPPSDEEIAAALLAEEKKAEEPKEPPREIKVTCPMCDEQVTFPAELAGKQAQCPNPECRRIVRVPALAQPKKVDWRDQNAGGPTAARRDTAPAPEGAWGSTAPKRASEEALVSAGVLTSDRPPRTLAQKIVRGLVAAAILVGLGAGVLAVVSWMGGKKQARLLARALEAVDGKDAVVKDETAAVVHMAAGLYHLGRDEPDSVKAEKGDGGAVNQFNLARSKLASEASDNAECDALLGELALEQLKLAGEEPAVSERKRLSAQAAVKEMAATLRAINQPEARNEALRRAARRMIDAGLPTPLLVQLATQSSGDPVAMAVVGLELFRANRTDDARQQAQGVAAHYGPLIEERAKAGGKDKDKDKDKDKEKPPPLSIPPDVIALMYLFDDRSREAKPADIPRESRAGVAASRAARGDVNGALELVKLLPTSLSKFEALAGMADYAGGQAEAIVLQAVGLAEAGKDRRLPALQVVRLVQAGITAGVDDDTLLRLARRISDRDQLRGWAVYQVLRARIDKSGTPDPTVLDQVDRGPLTQALARVELARLGAKKGENWEDKVEEWEESVRPFGLAGLALGLQEGG